MLETYNNFLGMLNDDSLRDKIEKLPMQIVYQDESFLKARENALSFQEALDHIFFFKDTQLM